MKSITITKEDTAIIHVAHKPKLEYYNKPVLECLAIGKGEIATTDGYIMARRKKDSVVGEEVVLINATEITAAFKGKKKGHTLVIDLETMTGMIGDSEPITFTKQEGNFPNLDNACPEYESVAILTIAIPVLKKLLGICGDDEYVTLQVPPNKESNIPTYNGVVTSATKYKTSGNTEGALMPYAANAFKNNT